MVAAAAKPDDVVLEESGYSKELEEELNRGTGDIADAENEPIGCWMHFTKAISSKCIPPASFYTAQLSYGRHDTTKG